jgi:hypothetical protein
VWWLKGIAKKEVKGIMSMLPLEWWPKMDWAVRVANYEGVIDEEIWGACWHSEGSPSPDEGFGGDIRTHIDLVVGNGQWDDSNDRYGTAKRVIDGNGMDTATTAAAYNAGG